MEESSVMEDDIDIYADLSVSQDKIIEQCKKCPELEIQVGEYTKKVEDLQTVNRNLERNISSLLMTAKGEISRKDRMIADLRRQLDDASFRRGNFRRYRNYQSEYNSEPNGVGFGNEDVTFNPNRPPPFRPDNFKTGVQLPPIPEDYKSDVPPPPLPENCESPPPSNKNYKTEYITPLSPENYDEEEYICNPDFDLEEEEDSEKNYDDGINRETLFSQRLRKRIEEEDELERKEKEQKAVLEEAERKENERLRLEDMRGSSSKVNIENKENKPISVNTSNKRSRDCEEAIEVKRPKMEPLYDALRDDFREDWSTCATEKPQIKEEPESSRPNYNKKSKEAEENKNLETRNNLALRLYLLSEGVPIDSAGRADSLKDSQKRKDDEKRYRDQEKYENERCENDRYKDKFLRERYEKDKYKEKLERERHERDKFDKEWYKHERDKYEKDKLEREKYEWRFEKDRFDRKRSRRSLSLSPERNRHFFEKRESRQRGFKHYDFDSRGRGRNQRFNRKADLRQRIPRAGQENQFIPDNYQSRRGREMFRTDSGRSRSNSFERNKREREFGLGSTNARSRSSSKEKSGRGRDKNEIYNSRSRSSSKDKHRREIEFQKRIINSRRSRSNSNDENYKNVDKKITLQEYKERTDRALLEGNPSEINRSKDIDQRLEEKKRILEMQKARLEMELSKLDSERSRSSSKEKDCKLNRRQSRERDKMVKVPVSTYSEFSDTFKKSMNKDLEEGELSDSSIAYFRSSQVTGTEHKVSQKPSDNPEKKIEDNIKNLEKTPIGKSIDKSKVEKGSKIENITDKLTKQAKGLNSISLNKDLVNNSKKVEIPEGTFIEKSKGEIDSVTKQDISFASQLQNRSEISIVKIDTTLRKPIERVSLIRSSEEVSDKKSDSLVVNPADDIEKHVRSLDSFIESAKKVLEENKREANRLEEVAKKADRDYQIELKKVQMEMQSQAPESEKKINIGPKKEDLNTVEGNKKKLSKCMKDLFSPVKERTNPRRGGSKERKEEKESSPAKEMENNEGVSKGKEGEVLSPVPEKKKQKRNESKERNGEVSSLKKVTESKVQTTREVGIEKQFGEDLEIKTENRADSEIKKEKELNPVKGGKNKQRVSKKKEEQDIPSPLKEKKKQKRNESKNRNEKEVSTLIEGTETKVQTIGEAEIEKQSKEDSEIKTEDKKGNGIKEEKESNLVKKTNKRRVSKGKEEGKISSPLKEKKNQKRNESKERHGKEVFTPVWQNIGEAEIKKDTKIKTQNKEDMKIEEKKKSSPAEKNKNKRRVSKGKEGEIPSPLKGEKNAETSRQKQNQSKEMNKKVDFSMVEDRESGLPKVGEAEMKKQVKEDSEVKTQDKKDAEIKEEKESNPVKEMKSKRKVPKEKEEGGILIPLKEKKKAESKRQTRNESKERIGKEVSPPVKNAESNLPNMRETEIKNQIEEDLEIKTHNREDTENKTQKKEHTEIQIQKKEDPENEKQKPEDFKAARPLKELNPPESNKEDSKISSPVKYQGGVKDQREELEPKVEVSSNTLSLVGEKRKQVEQVEAQKLKETELKAKEPKKVVQKVKEVVPAKSKTKKVEEQPKKKIIVVVRKRKRPPVLSDCNASTTIVSNENVITNIKLNNSGDKNLLS